MDERIHGLSGQEKSIARDQHHIVHQGVHHPRYDAVKPLKVRRVGQHVALELRPALFRSTKHNGPVNAGIGKAGLEPFNATKHGGFVFTHSAALSSGKDDGNGHDGIPQCMLSSSSSAVSNSVSNPRTR